MPPAGPRKCPQAALAIAGMTHARQVLDTDACQDRPGHRQRRRFPTNEALGTRMLALTTL
jgi:hypothetical protein